MFEPTINDAATIAGGSTGTMLANRYRVVRQLGSGGMGSVWLVEDVKLDNKPFAVKMLPAILVSNRRAYEQVKREALIALKLVHPNIVQFRALEEAVEGGNPFIVMDYIDGRTLDEYLAEKGKLTEDETLRVLRPVANALDYAHGEGVVHRDVKPGNVMIRRDGRPFVLDFGIAREIQETMTRVTGKLSSGTLMYMSPEQLHGAVPKPAQDVYSFAAMAYECLTGAPPFSRGQIEYQIDHDTPAPLILPTGGSSVRGSGTLAASVMAGLAKKPEDRPATCAAVLAGTDFTQRRREAESQSGRARSPSAPQGGENVRVEHIERVEGNAPDNDNGKISRKKIIVALLGLAVIGGLWWGLSKDKDKDKDIKPTQSERGVRRMVQLWEGGPYWACKNIGAEEPWESGYYFWWGDTVGYKRQGDVWVASDGSKSNFTFENKNTLTFEKSITDLQREGWITSDNVLVPEHDAAHVHWGDGWRMPTIQELNDLKNKCDWTWTRMNGVDGYVVRGKGAYTSANIFLPCAGYGNGASLDSAGSDGDYWSSVPNSDYGSIAWYLYFNSGGHGTNGSYYRYYGRSVRPVQGFTK